MDNWSCQTMAHGLDLAQHLFFFFSFWLHHASCRGAVPNQAWNTCTFCVEARTVNHWPSGALPTIYFCTTYELRMVFTLFCILFCFQYGSFKYCGKNTHNIKCTIFKCSSSALGVTTEADTGLLWPQVKGCQQPREAGRTQELILS